MEASPHTESLATLLHLARRAREAVEPAELRFILVNETHALSPYRQAALWLDREVAALSGVVSPEANAPYVLWLSQVFRHVGQSHPQARCASIDAGDLPAALSEEWHAWLPARALWVRLGPDAADDALLLAREEPWSEAEITLIAEWAAL